MQVGDLVRLSKTLSNPAAIQDWGFGLIDKVHKQNSSVTVIWPQKSYNSTKVPRSRVEVVSESR